MINNFNLPEIENEIYNNCNTFLVVGAFDGESHDTFFQGISNKDKKNGTIIFVEPVQKCFDKLLTKVELLTGFDIRCNKFAISDKNEFITLASVKSEKISNYPWYIDGCSCVIENGIPINIYIKEIPAEDLDFETIQTKTFEQLLEFNELTSIDFLQVDTEGYDERIVNSINFEVQNIKFIKFELFYLSPNFLDSFKEKMNILGYSFYTTHEDCFFIKNDFLKEIQEIKQEKELLKTLKKDENDEFDLIKNTEYIVRSSSDVVNISFYGSHNSAVVVEKNKEILCVIEIERFINIKNSGYGQYLTAGTRFFLIKKVLQYIKEKYSISRFNTCYYSNTDTIEGHSRVNYEKFIPADNYVFCLHHLSHAASGLYQTNYDEALIISFDGGGSDGFFNIYHAENRETINFVSSLNHDLGFAYMSFGDYLSDIRQEHSLSIGNLVYSGKIMGLCSYGNVNNDWLPHFENYYLSKPDGNNYINLLRDLSDKTGLIFDRNNRLEGQLSWDVAKTSQIAFENVFMTLSEPFLNQFPNIPLILVGGCALNILLNTKLQKELNREVFIPPNPNDCGIASGMILLHSKPKTAVDLTYSGIDILDKEMLMTIAEGHYNVFELNMNELVDDLIQGKIVGIVKGKSEHGPRALGNRSIICNPYFPEMKDILNKKVKNREWYRPFAPVCRLEDINKYFDFNQESRWMGFCPMVREEWKEKLSSITHVDGTARVQTVTKDQNPWLYDLLTQFDEKFGIGVLLNTSFNINGKPILSSYRDAYKLFSESEMDRLLLDDVYFKK